MKRPAPQTLAALAALGVLGLAALLTSPPQPDALPDTYASTDYSAGGYRAWAALLGREGVSTERFVLRPIELDDRIDTLITAPPPALARSGQTRSAADFAALAAWVRRGGRLVYVGRDPARAEAEHRLLRLPHVLAGIGASGRLEGPLAGRIGTLGDAGSDRMLFVDQPGRSELADRNGDLVVRYPLGRGEVVAAVDPATFDNAHIGATGNARLAYLLALPRAVRGRVAFDDAVHGALIDRPWYRVLPMGVRVSVALMGLAALATLIGGALRNGPPVAPGSRREPTSVEFIDALAALYARMHAREAARTILARDALAVAASSAGVGDRATAVEIAARLGRGRGGAAVRRLVEGLDAPLTTDSALLASAQLAYAIRKDWSHGRNGDERRAAVAGRARTRRRR